MYIFSFWQQLNSSLLQKKPNNWHIVSFYCNSVCVVSWVVPVCIPAAIDAQDIKFSAAAEIRPLAKFYVQIHKW